MPDLLSEAFAKFVEDAGREVVTPGAKRAKRTAIRRRNRRAVLASLAAVLVVAGGIGIAAAVNPGRMSTPISPPSAGTTYDATKLDMLRLHAVSELRDLGYPGVTAVFSDSAVLTAPLVSKPGPPMTAGKHTLEMQCYGVGVVTVRWTIGNRTKSYDLGCIDSDGTGGSSNWLDNDRASSGASRIDLTPNSLCLNRCAVAFRVVNGWDGE